MKLNKTSIRLDDDTKKLIIRLSGHLTAREGKPISQTEVIKRAITLLAKQELDSR